MDSSPVIGKAFELQCGTQNYLWGKLGKKSLVAHLLKSANPKTKVEKNTPYAELWMGCHPSAPSKIKETRQSLTAIVEKKPAVLGPKVVETFGNQLPFLFKVLSINNALSIQAHPSKKLAKELNASKPDIYKDDNYKPEMAIALTPFEALCGFRPVCEIRAFLKAVPELRNLIPNVLDDDDFQLVKNAFRSVLQNSKEKVQEELTKLLDRLGKIDNEEQKKFENVELIQRLNKEFPGDVGIFMVYFLNHIKLKEGEAIYIAECEPHAYLSGECVECMACSDNVVRAGLTPKFVDVDTLVSMLSYQCKSPEDNYLSPKCEDCYSLVFKPPVPDFAIAHIKVPARIYSYGLIKRSTASILLVITGKGRSDNIELVPGTVLFIPADEEIEIDLIEDMDMYQAFVNV